MVNALSVANLIIAVQALFLFIHFSLKKKGVKALNSLVAIQVVVFGIVSLNTYLILSDRDTLFFQELSNNSLWFFAPSMYLFVTNHQRAIPNRILLIHLAPFVILAMLGLILYDTDYLSFFPGLGFLQMLIYLSLTMSYCYRHYQSESAFINWALPSIVTFIVILVANFSLKALVSSGQIFVADELLLSLTTLLSIPVFYMAYREMNASPDFGRTPKKYRTSHLSDDQLTNHLEQVDRIMKEEKLFLDPELQLSSLAEKVGIPQKYISQAINQRLKKSFTTYLLELRLAQAEQDLLDPQNKHMTIQGIAQNAGFASLSRFSQHFKQYKGLTPGQFQRQHMKR